MSARILAAAVLALTLTHAHAFAGEASADAGMAAATAACQGVNQYGPVELVDTVADGLGDWLVWAKDKDGDLWLCNASSEGAVFANTVMQGDLLAGDGGSLVNLQQASNSGGNRFARANPADTATALCASVGGYMEKMQVVETVEDGLGDYVVWLQNDEKKFWMCNASADAKLYDFEPVDMPLNDVAPVETHSA